MSAPVPHSDTAPRLDMGPSGFPTGTSVGRARPWPGWVPFVLGVAAFAMAAAGAAGAVVVISGTLDGEWYDVRDLGFAMQRLGSELRGGGGGQREAAAYLVPTLIGAAGILAFVGASLLSLVWVERRLLARFQVRRGPNRVGPFGLLQPVADALKLLQKEVLIPRGADRFLFLLPPILVFIPGMLIWGPVPWAPGMAYLDINVGVLYLVAVGSLTTVPLFIAGWSSNNHYALLGSMRTVAMMISYELPQSIALLSVVLVAGSMNLGDIVQWQADHNLWLGLLLPLPLFTFFFAATAELNRTPNDIAEAESEIVAGFHTEYSGMKFGLFNAVELANTFAVGALVATLFLGGWSLFGLEEWVPKYLVLMVKISAVYFVLVWLRGTLPRFRLDQLLAFAWKFLIPLAIMNAFLVAVEVAILERSPWPGLATLAFLVAINIGLTVSVVRVWSRALGYRPEQNALRRPALVSQVGGLEAAERMRQAAPREVTG